MQHSDLVGKNCKKNAKTPTRGILIKSHEIEHGWSVITWKKFLGRIVEKKGF